MNKTPSRRDFLRHGLGLAGCCSISWRKRLSSGDLAGSTERKLDLIIPQLINEYKVPGLSAALIEDGKLRWSKGYGIKEIESNKPVTPETVFELASLSKPTFAYAVLKLAGQGRLGLDKPLTNYHPEPFIADEPRLQSITARMILSHTSGIPHGRQGTKPLSLLFDPGKRFQYSATGFDYLQKVVNGMTRQSLESLMRETVLDPFGMANSNFGWRETYDSQIAQAYNPKGEAGQTFNEKYRKASEKWREAVAKSNPELSYPSAAAGLYGTAADFARFLIEIITPSATDSAHLSPHLLNEMLSPQIKVTKEVSWGLGWGILQTKADDAIWHWGNWNGLYQHFAAVLKNEKRGVVILTNSGNGLALCKKLVPLAIGLDIKPIHRFFDD